MSEHMVPKRRFKEFQNCGDWERRKLGEIGSISMCKRIFKEQTSEEGDVPFYKIGTFGGVADAFISQELFEEYKVKYPYPPKGGILISASGSIGRTVEFTGKNEYFQDSNIVWLKHDKRLDDTFLNYFYEIVEWAGIEGSTIKRLYNDNILKTEITMPCIGEQKDIGNFFCALDQLISLYQRKFDKMKTLKIAYLSEMFPAEGERKPKRRFKGFTDSWELRKLGDLVNLENGFAFKSDYFIDEPSKYIVLTPGSVRIGGGYQSGKGRSYSENGEMPEKFIFKSGDVFVTMTDLTPSAQSLGYAAVVPCDKNVYLHNQRLGKLELKNVDKKFLLSLLSTSSYHKQIVETASGTTVKHSSPAKILGCRITVPNNEEQKKIGHFFHQLNNAITLHHQTLEKLQNIKRAYLNEMFIEGE